jgi:hypothetical protein
VGTPSCVTITHPFHPLRGQKLELAHVPRKANSKLSVRHPEGRCFSIPREWTDFEAQQDDQAPAPPDRPLDIKGLLEIAGIIGSIKTEDHLAETAKGKDS